MVTAVILIHCERGQVQPVAEALAEQPEITEVYSVGGAWDLVAIVRTPSNERLASLVTETVAAIPGIADTQTLIAFKVYSQHDLERLFAVGMDEEA